MTSVLSRSWKTKYIRDIAICERNMATNRAKELERQRQIDRE